MSSLVPDENTWIDDERAGLDGSTNGEEIAAHEEERFYEALGA